LHAAIECLEEPFQGSGIILAPSSADEMNEGLRRNIRSKLSTRVDQLTDPICGFD